MVPGLSASSSSSFLSSTSMTPSRQEIDHPTSSSSLTTSSTTTVLSDSETREREDRSGIDSHPVLVSSSYVERIERGGPLLPKATKNPKPNKNENHFLEQQSCQVKVWTDKHGETRSLLKHQKICYMNQPKSQNQKK